MFKHDWRKIIGTEMKYTFLFSNIFQWLTAAILPLAIIMIQLLVNKDFGTKMNVSNGNSTIVVHVFFVSFIVASLSYTPFMRIRNIISDKATLDRNRLEYQLFDKSAVAIAKLLGEVVPFLLITILIVLIGVVGFSAKFESLFPVDYAFIAAAWIMVCVFYFIVVFIAKLILSRWGDKLGKVLAILVLFILQIPMIAFPPISGASKVFNDFIMNNKALIFFLPGLNFISPSLVFWLSPNQLYYPIGLVITVVVLCSITFKSYAYWSKKYLCIV